MRNPCTCGDIAMEHDRLGACTRCPCRDFKPVRVIDESEAS